MSTQDNVFINAAKSFRKNQSYKKEGINHRRVKQSKNEDKDNDSEILKKHGISFDDDNDILSSSMSLMSIVSTSPEDSMGDKINTKSISYCDYEAATSFGDIEYSEYDFDDEEETTCNNKFNFKIYQDVIGEMPIMEKKKYKNGTRSSLTFSNQRVAEIERDNRNLLQKIMRNGPSGDIFLKPKSSIINQRPKIKSAAEVNRRKQQQQIYYENQILKRKLDKIASRRASLN